MRETKQFQSAFVSELANAASTYGPASVREGTVPRLLDGAAASAVTSHVPSAIRARDGIFFSGHLLANKALCLVADAVQSGGVVFDPACGAGDLLLAAAKLLPLQPSLPQTLSSWTKRLRGFDLHADFVLASRWRLLLLAMLRHSERGESIGKVDLQAGHFCNLIQRNYLSEQKGDFTGVIIVNPPYGHMAAPDDCQWSSGKTQVAALFMERVVKNAEAGQEIVAILPDVLRSGIRYGKWREYISRLAAVTPPVVHGRFDEQTDVDVFLLKLVKRPFPLLEAQHEWAIGKPTHKASEAELKDLFDISVGPVVPHRHKGDKGPWRKYLDVKNAPAFGEAVLESSKRFDGKTHHPPFLTLRRTSSPSDAMRLVPTLVLGNADIAVENHLIVLKPIRGGEKACRSLMKQLSTAQATAWINERMRCRHIAITVLKRMPIECELA